MNELCQSNCILPPKNEGSPITLKKSDITSETKNALEKSEWSDTIDKNPKYRVCKRCLQEKMLDFLNFQKIRGHYLNKCRECFNFERRLAPRVKKKYHGVIPSFKVCYTCKIEKSSDNFHRDINRGNGLYPNCKDCRRFESYKYKSKSREKISRSGAQYRKDNKELTFYLGSKNRAKKKNQIFELELKDIIIPKFCPVLGIPLFFGDGWRTDNTPSLERINNSLGYTKSNCLVISWRANNIKSNASVEELGKVYDFYKDFNYEDYNKNSKNMLDREIYYKEICKKYSASKSRARLRGLDFKITRDDIFIPKVCPALGIQLRFNNTYLERESSPSMDRVDNSKGYTKDNIVMVSFRANKIKNYSSVEELGKIYNFYKKLL